jgi:methyl-accepting chemotaxis protein
MSFARWFGPVLVPGRALVQRLSLAHKLMVLLGVPLLALLAAAVLVALQARQDRDEVVERLQGLAALEQVQAAQARLVRHRQQLTAPALAGSAPASSGVPALRLPPRWQLAEPAQAAQRCVDALRGQAELQDPAAYLSAHAACLDRLDQLALAIAQRSGLARATREQGYALVDWWLHLGLPLHRAGDRLSTLLGRPSAAAHLVPDDMATWTRPAGTVDRLLAQSVSRLEEARREATPVPAGFDAVRLALQAQREAIDAKLSLGDLVPAAELPARAAAAQASTTALRRFDAALRQQLQAQLDTARARLQHRFWALVGGSAALLALCGYLAAACAMAFVEQFGSLRDCLARLTGGDLQARARVHGRDEAAALAEDVNRLAGRLQQLVDELLQGSHGIADLGTRLGDGATALAERSEAQARSLDRSAEVLQAVAHGVERSATLAEAVRGQSHLLREQAGEGRQQVGETVRSMQRIAERAQRMSQSVQAIEAITMQTRLLSLNATIEAAHAGGAGRGFALVAHEVRALADRTAQVAAEIQAMIHASGEEVQAGLGQVQRLEALSEQVAQHSADTAERMRTVAGQSAEQRHAMQALQAALAELADITETNRAGVRAAVDEAGALTLHAVRLRDSAARLQPACLT